MPKCLFILLFCAATISAQQFPDTLYHPFIAQAAYANGEGPRITFDAGHHNFGAERDGYAALKKLLRRDGYRVTTAAHDFSSLKSLQETDVLVIINALHETNAENWARPIHSAFTNEEISNLELWVKRGGRLLLVGDHMPFGGAAKKLGAAFGCDWVDGFAKINPFFWPPSHFAGKEMVNEQSPVIKGLQAGDQVSRIGTFTGSAFKAPPEAVVALSFLPENTSVQPDTAWRFKANSPEISLAGYAQGATLDYGKGRVAFWGEAGMLSAQIFRQDWKAGFNSPYAPENAQLARNLFHWLSDAQVPFRTPVQQKPMPGKVEIAAGLEAQTLSIKNAYAVGELVSNAAITAEIQAQFTAMETAYEAGDLLTLAYFYDDDAVVAGVGFQIEGREAIDKYWFSFQGLTEKWQLNSELVYANEAGDRAYQLGTSTISYRNPASAEVVTDVTRFALVWRKNFAGNWKIITDQYAQ